MTRHMEVEPTQEGYYKGYGVMLAEVSKDAIRVGKMGFDTNKNEISGDGEVCYKKST